MRWPGAGSGSARSLLGAPGDLIATALGGALLPAPDQTLLLRACLHRGEAGRRAWAAWTSQKADPRRALALEHGGAKALVPLLLDALQASGAHVDPALLPHLRAARIHEELRSRRYREIAATALAALGEADIPAIVLGGAALAEIAYPDPVLRHCHGLDLLVHAVDVARARVFLAERGFRQGDGTAGARGCGATLEHASGLRVALRTRPFELPYYGAPVGALWARCERRVVAGEPSRVLSPADALVHVCGHASYSAGRRAHVWVCDGWLLAERRRDLDWDTVVACASASRLALPMGLMLGYLAAALDAPIPAECLTRLHTAVGTTDAIGWRVALHGARRADPGGLFGVVRRSRSWPERARVLRWMLAPPAAYFDAIGQDRPAISPAPYVARSLRYLADRARELARPGVTSGAAPVRRRRRWPDDDRELALRAALLRGTAAVDAWNRLRARRDPAQVNLLAWELRPLVYANLRRLGVRDPLVETFKAAYRATWSRNEKSLRHLQRVLVDLREAGVDALLLKGGALALQYYGDVGLRPMSDLDLLVPPARVGEAIAALQRFGWSCPHSLTAAFLDVKHAAPFVDADGCNCDLHWRVLEEYCPPDADAEFLEAAVELALPGMPARVPAPADQLLHVCVHGTKWAETPGVRWVADAVYVLRAGGIDWERFARQAVKRRVTLPARAALTYLCARFDAPVPPDVLAGLLRLPVSRLERLEYHLKGRPHSVLGEFPLYCFNYLRSVEGHRAGRTLGFLRYLQRAWELPSIAQIPRAVLARAVPRLNGMLRRPRRGVGTETTARRS